MRVASAVLLVLSATAHVGAQPDSRPSTEAPEADRLFAEGRALAKERRYAEACDRFARSYAIDPSLGTQLNLADCKEALGDHREAWRLFVDAAKRASGDPARVAFARKRATAIEARLATVNLRLAQPAPPGLAIAVQGRPVAQGPEIRDVTEPGAVEVVASAPGHTPFKTVVNVPAGATVVVDVPKLAAVATATPTLSRDRGRVRTALIVGVGGGVALVAAGGLTLKARSDYRATTGGSDCTQLPSGLVCNDVGQRDIDDAQRLADVGTGFVVIGGALVVTAAFLYVTAPRSAVTVTPAVSTDSVGAIFTRAF